VNILYDRDSGRSRGFGFVSFCKEDEAVSAKDAMDGKVSMRILALFSFFVSVVEVLPRMKVNNFIAGIVRSSIENKLCS
jgi:RNA recognition motif-containing protein